MDNTVAQPQSGPIVGKCKQFAEHLRSHKGILSGILVSKITHHMIIRSHDKKKCKPSETKRNLSVISTLAILIAWVLAIVGGMQISMSVSLGIGLFFWLLSSIFR